MDWRRLMYGSQQVEAEAAETGVETEPALENEPAAEVEEQSSSELDDGISDALAERYGFTPSQAPPGDSAFDSGPSGVAGELSGLPVRVDQGRRPDGGTSLIRIRLGLVTGEPAAAEKALSETPVWRVSASRLGVEVLAAPEHSGSETDAALAYVEGLAQRCAVAMKLEESSRPSDSARIFTVCGYPRLVSTPDTTDVEGVELRHFELGRGEAEWEELAVRLSPTADGAMVATGTWDEEAPFISLMGRIAMVRQGEGGGETPVMLGSGVCTLTNRRLLAVVYARPDDDVLQSLGQSLRQSGITFQDASGRNVNPFLAIPEEEKSFQFIDKAGAVDEQGGGVVLALSAFPQAFARVDIDGGILQRGLGIPGMELSGGPLTFRVVPFRVLDQDSHTVKPRRGQIKDAVNAWWAMTTQASQ